jgi:hypothetical protein
MDVQGIILSYLPWCTFAALTISAIHHGWRKVNQELAQRRLEYLYRKHPKFEKDQMVEEKDRKQIGSC